MKWLLICCVKIYQWILSPIIGPSCCFQPTCSAYMIEALKIHGSFKGLCLGIRRLLRCHPWSKACLYDPVPPKES